MGACGMYACVCIACIEVWVSDAKVLITLWDFVLVHGAHSFNRLRFRTVACVLCGVSRAKSQIQSAHTHIHTRGSAWLEK